jgi:hypothetical protein
MKAKLRCMLLLDAHLKGQLQRENRLRLGPRFLPDLGVLEEVGIGWTHGERMSSLA